VNLFNGITGYDNGGVWSAELPSANTGVIDSVFASDGLAYQVFNFEYRLTDGCAYDSIVSQVQVYGPSSAGNDGTITVCKNEPYDLLSGLTGNVDVGGTWYDPSNNALPDSWLTAGNIPGQFNYDYVTGNGICPNDTSNVLVTVDASCNYFGLNDLGFETIQIYPNPTNGIVNISSPEALQASITVRDINGRLISSNSEINLIHTFSIDLSQSESGIYLIEVELQNQIRNYRIILN
jgi:hypothetical protein